MEDVIIYFQTLDSQFLVIKVVIIIIIAFPTFLIDSIRILDLGIMNVPFGMVFIATESNSVIEITIYKYAFLNILVLMRNKTFIIKYLSKSVYYMCFLIIK